MSKGDDANCMFIVIKGEVGIYLDEGLKVRLASIKDNHIFGERALLRQIKRTAWAKAHTRTICLTLSTSDFDNQIYYRDYV